MKGEGWDFPDGLEAKTRTPNSGGLRSRKLDPTCHN